ncbi:hypothetical protein GH714_043878 [Hevea brasiliensis]|uniref:Uncharacterized protein n=1 Tax=Hevea brasiliensis TaxID=3981 RepID=A0A6A6K0P6_HEVBR|nr:hypothetical protein GH714_043878 [Hevea brasiliensis]
MASDDGDDHDVVLSDVEGEDPVPIVVRTPSLEDVSVDRYRELLAELDRERAAREAAETSKSELQVSFNRLKVLAHEAIKKRDECGRQRDEAVREKEEALKEKDESVKQRDEIAKQFEEAVKGRDGLQSEFESSRHMLVSGIEKISGKIDATAKSRNEAREQMEQRNYEIAIEVSQLEATISGLRDEVEKKTSLIENLEKSVVEKEWKVSAIEREMFKKTHLVENEALVLRELISEYDDKLINLESRMELQRPLLIDQLNLVAKIHDRLYDVIKIVDANHLDSELSESLFLPQRTDMEENIRASLAGMESIYELTRIIVEKTRDLLEEKSHEAKSLNETIENGLREAGIDFKFSKILGDHKVPTSQDKDGSLDTEENEIYTLAGALENIVKTSQLEIIELQHSVEELRAEASLLKEHIEAQAKELDHRMCRIEELEGRREWQMKM